MGVKTPGLNDGGGGGEAVEPVDRLRLAFGLILEVAVDLERGFIPDKQVARAVAVDAIVADLDASRHDFHVAVENFAHDFNIGSVIRTAGLEGSMLIGVA